MPKVWRIVDLIQWSESYFREKSHQNPRLEIEWMLCSLLNCERLDLYMRFDEPLSGSQLSTLRGWVKRRSKNEPLQYITESCEFYGREFFVDKRVLIPRPETERLIDEAIKSIKHVRSPNIFDIGTGSGCIAITLAKEIENSNVIGIDKSIMSLQVAKKNSAELNVDNVTFFEMDILNQYPKEKFDLVISNPPYVPKKEIPSLMKDVKDFEPEIALTDFDDGLTFYKRISKIIPHILKDDSSCILELGLGNHPEKVLSIFKESGYSNMEIFDDYNGDKRVLSIKT
ncbi:MAG: release factor glutamine methyltransferase [Candidatus Neomarinimicrobiota bacterium]|nr:MAG: release factor glutamine methyltransferase [Candidatus Neomarinimicrobiota bacterium]